MADKKISALTAATTPLAGTEVLPIVQSGTTVKATVANIVGAGTSPGSFTTLAASSDVSATNGTIKSPVAMNLKVTDAGGTERTTVTLAVPIAASTQGFSFTNGKSGATYPTLTAVGGTISTQAIRFTDNFEQGTAAKGVNFTANTPLAGMTSQLLNWYEEGVSTVTLAFGGGSTGIVYSSQQCRYTRIGNRVMFQIGLAISNAGSSTGAATISGLPFTSKNIGYGANLFAVNAQNMAGSTGVIFALLPENSSTIALKNINAGGNVNVDFTNAAWGAGSYVTISGQYLVA